MKIHLKILISSEIVQLTIFLNIGNLSLAMSIIASIFSKDVSPSTE
jgi:hypothetical protein